MALTGDKGLTIPREYIQALGKRLPQALGKAIRDTVFDVREGLYIEMEDVFDRPTPFIVPANKKKPGRRGSLFVEYDVKKFTGRVYAKDLAPQVLGTSLNAEQILLPNITGQEREHKRFEKALYRAGVLPRGYFAVPAKDMPRDKYGNIRRGQITQILSYLQANPDAAQNRTNRSAEAKKYSYYVVYARDGKAVGIAKRTYSKTVRQRKDIRAQGGKTSPGKRQLVFHFVKGNNYQKDFLPFEYAGELVIRRQWPKNFDYWAKQAIKPKEPLAA